MTNDYDEALPAYSAPTAYRDDEAAFLAGARTDVHSSWHEAAQYVPLLNELKVWFRGGYSCTLHDVSPGLALSYYNAPSHGIWWHREVLGPRYVRGKPVTARMRWTDTV